MTKLITIGNEELIRVGRDYPCPISVENQIGVWFSQISLKGCLCKKN